MRILRYVLIGLGAVLLLAVAAVAVFLATFDAEDYKPRIEAAARDATGRELTLAGPIRLKPSLRPTLEVKDATFANAEWGSRPAMARLAAMEVALAVLPLLRGEIAIERLVLVEPDILLETDAEGRGNWEVAPRAAEPAAPRPGAPPGSAVRRRRSRSISCASSAARSRSATAGAAGPRRCRSRGSRPRSRRSSRCASTSTPRSTALRSRSRAPRARSPDCSIRPRARPIRSISPCVSRMRASHSRARSPSR